jgi:ATP citrate (pro-S)-lyase
MDPRQSRKTSEGQFLSHLISLFPYSVTLPQVESVTGTLSSFIVEPFLPHPSDSEYYICITSARHADTLLFTTSGGVDVGDVDAKALKLDIPVLGPFPSRADLQKTLLREVPAHKKEVLTDFLVRLYSVYVDLHFAYLEINPLVVLDDGSIHYLDMAAKLDQTAESICGPKWAVARDLTVYETAAASTTTGSKINADRGPPMAWPAPFGRDLTKEEGVYSVDDCRVVLILHSIHSKTRRFNWCLS